MSGSPVLRFVLVAAALLPATRAVGQMTYAVSPDGGVYALDLAAADADLLFTTGVEWLGASDSGTPGVLYGAVGFDNDFVALHTIDIALQTVTQIGDWGGVEIRELAYDAEGDVLYGSEQDELFVIDQTTGRASLIGRYFGPSAMYALAYIRTLDALIGVDFATDFLYRISPDTGRAQLIGDTAVDRISDLWYDEASDRLFGVTNFDGRVYAIDYTTAESTLVGETGAHLSGLGIGVPAPGGAAAVALAGGAWLLRARRRNPVTPSGDPPRGPALRCGSSRSCSWPPRRSTSA